MLVDSTVFNEGVCFSDEEVDADCLDEQNDSHDVFFVKRHNRFFRRRFYPKKGQGKSRYGQYSMGSPSYNYGKGRSEYQYNEYNPSYPQQPIYGKSKGKGKPKGKFYSGKKGKMGSAYVVEGHTPSESSEPTSLVLRPSLPDPVEEAVVWYPEYDSYWSDEWQSYY